MVTEGSRNDSWTSPCIHSSRGSRETIDGYLRVVPTCLKQKSGRPRAKVELRWGHMSGGSMTISFLNAASSAWICAPPTQIQKLVRLKHSQCAFCFALTMCLLYICAFCFAFTMCLLFFLSVQSAPAIPPLQCIEELILWHHTLPN